MKKVKKKNNTARIIILFVCIMTAILIWADNGRLSVTYYDYSDDSITEDGFKIVQLSDVHNASFGINNKRLINKLKALEPDIIVITGDMVDSNHTNVEKAVNLSKELTKISDTFYVTGNHDYWLSTEDYNAMIDGMREAGVRILYNEVIDIEAAGYDFSLVGLDDKNLSDKTLSNLIEKTSDTFYVVLAHEPQYLDKYAQAGSDLVLSGHVHGGQFRLPFVGGLLSPEHGFMPEYDAGLYECGNTQMIVSRGLGNSVIRVRLFNNPEIVCVTLKSK